MVHITRYATPLAPLTGNRRSRATVDNSGTSFTDDLAAAIQQHLSQRGDGSRVQVEIQSQQGHDSAGRQIIVTVVDPPDASTADPQAEAGSSTAASTEPAPPLNRSMMYSGTVQYVPQAQAATVEDPVIDNEVDAYWAMQPPKVQELRHISDDAARTERGLELAADGFAIDVPIMIWRWDPLTTMRARQTAGYTWVPAAGQASVPVGPGLSFPDMPEYDPTVIPEGAIRVTTEFAEGLEHTSPWWRVMTTGEALPSS